MTNEKRLPKFMTTRFLLEKVCPWSDDTLRRRIDEDGFPAFKDGKSYVFETEKVLEWFKRRSAQAG